jgi:tetratricopeptide (TPR) repeat protein
MIKEKNMTLSIDDFKDTLALLEKNFQSEEQSAQFIADTFFEVNNNGKALKDVLKIKDKSLDELYKIGFEYFKYGQYELAVTVFHKLFILNQKSPSYTYALGASHAELKNFDKAAIAFFLSFLNDNSNLEALFNSADCRLKNKDNEAADQQFKAFLQLSQGLAKYDVLRTKATLILENLKSKKV